MVWVTAGRRLHMLGFVELSDFQFDWFQFDRVCEMIQILVYDVEVECLSAGSTVSGVFYPGSSFLQTGRRPVAVSHPSAVGCQQ